MLVASAAHGHQGALSLDDWGGFGSGPAGCARAIARAAATCSSRSIALHHACMLEVSAGGTCDEEKRDAGVARARSRAIASVDRACSSTDADNLRYVDVSEAMTDVIDICRQQVNAFTSSVFGPLSLNGGAASDPRKRACLRATASLSARLLRAASRARRSAFDDIAAEAMQPEQRRALVQKSGLLIESAERLLRRRFDAACPPEVFQSVYRRDSEAFFDAIARRADCLAGAAYVQNEVTCPPPVCANGMQESGEQCDDGNDYDGDNCRADCVSNDCELFPSTFASIQKAVFENRGCTEQICHGADRAGDLDLRAGISYGELIDQPSTTVPGWKRIDPGDKDGSLLWINLAARTLPGHYTAPLRGMPLLGDPISEDELEAIRIWIDTGGASETTAVPGTDTLLNACLPEPVPGEIDPLDPPPADQGLQMHMPEWTLPPKSESEVCYSSYYDFTGKIPAYALSEDGTHFRYKRVDIRQDPLSHHLIVDLYRGPEPANDPSWGTYTCKGGAKAGTVCDPLELGFCGTGDCATDPDHQAIGCIGFGPSTSLTTLTSGGFAFAQETTAEFIYPDGVYDELPIKGLALWNSHAFNLTRQTGYLEGWVNITFPSTGEQLHKQKQIFDVSKIFLGDGFFPAFIQPFQKLDACNVHVFGTFFDPFVADDLPRNQKAHIFEISGHTHRHGKRFQIFRGTFTCKGGQRNTLPCSPLEATMCPGGGQCTDDGGRDPDDALLYTNLVYNDPVRVRFDPPMVFDGAAPAYDRSLTYCAHYSNGTPDIFDVKRRSTSPPAGEIFGFSIGGPCPVNQTRCIGGPQHDQLCNGDDAFCDSTAGAGDGDCDACPLSGGFRTEDEMFVLFGNYWIE